MLLELSRNSIYITLLWEILQGVDVSDASGGVLCLVLHPQAETRSHANSHTKQVHFNLPHECCSSSCQGSSDGRDFQ